MGERVRRGAITKAGNSHLRRIAMAAAWSYRHRPAVSSALRQRQEVVREEVKEIAWKQQHRFLARYRNLTARRKNKGQVITAIGRELVGFHLGHRKTAVGFSFVYKR